MPFFKIYTPDEAALLPNLLFILERNETTDEAEAFSLAIVWAWWGCGVILWERGDS
jgi:hypothetical protein